MSTSHYLSWGLRYPCWPLWPSVMQKWVSGKQKNGLTSSKIVQPHHFFTISVCNKVAQGEGCVDCSLHYLGVDISLLAASAIAVMPKLVNGELKMAFHQKVYNLTAFLQSLLDFRCPKGWEVLAIPYLAWVLRYPCWRLRPL